MVVYNLPKVETGVRFPLPAWKYKNMEVRFFDENLERFVHTLQKPTISKVLRAIDLIQQFGPHLRMPHSKHIGEGLFELRIRGVEEVRLIYTFHKNAAMLLHGFLKKSKRISRKEIELAMQKLCTLDRI